MDFSFPKKTKSYDRVWRVSVTLRICPFKSYSRRNHKKRLRHKYISICNNTCSYLSNVLMCQNFGGCRCVFIYVCVRELERIAISVR